MCKSLPEVVNIAISVLFHFRRILYMRNGVHITQFDICWQSAQITHSRRYRLYRTSANSV